jgi:stearoyl-CoA desaturase (delta-9 desaturase)
VAFFTATTLLALPAPFYIGMHGLSVPIWILSIFYTLATGLSITVGYHRLFAHVTYKAHPAVRFLLLFFGAAAFEQSALKWSSQHRDHHQYLDTERDPYSVTRGFWHAHMGWLIFWKHHVTYDNVKDLQKNALIMHQHRHFLLWAIASGIALPLVVGAWAGDVCGALLVSVALRITLVYHATFCINSICHWMGRPNYDAGTSARDHWFVAFLTFGEGYHSFHHRFPGDYRNGIRWYHWDPSKWLIGALSFFKLAYDLKEVSRFRILHARLRVKNQIATEVLLKSIEQQPLAAQLMEALRSKYLRLEARLQAFEKSHGEYQDVVNAMKKTVSRKRQEIKGLKEAAFEKMAFRRARFKSCQKQWAAFVRAGLRLAPSAS